MQPGNMEMFYSRGKAAECSRSGIVGPVILFFSFSFFSVGPFIDVFIVYVG